MTPEERRKLVDKPFPKVNIVKPQPTGGTEVAQMDDSGQESEEGQRARITRWAVRGKKPSLSFYDNQQ